MNPAALAALLNGDFANAIAASTPGGIEAQEAAGQRAMAATQNLPREGLNREMMEELGFVFGENVDGLFVSAKFPEGWTIKPTSHSMHSDLLDDKGRKRASIFYKAAFYDRNANIYLTKRYNYRQFPCDENNDVLPDECDWNSVQYDTVAATDNDKPIHFFGMVTRVNTYDRGYYDLVDKMRADAAEWLDKNFPDHKNVLAYWD